MSRNSVIINWVNILYSENSLKPNYDKFIGSQSSNTIEKNKENITLIMKKILIILLTILKHEMWTLMNEFFKTKTSQQ